MASLLKGVIERRRNNYRFSTLKMSIGRDHLSGEIEMPRACLYCMNTQVLPDPANVIMPIL